MTAFLVLAFPIAVMAQATGQQEQQDQSVDTVKATHGDWDVVCLTADPKQCRLRQVGMTADGKRALVVHIAKLDGVKTQDGKIIPAAIRVTTPLGTILRAGLKVQIDGAEPQTGGFEVCVPSGCIVSEPISEEFLKRLQAGNVAKMSFNVLQQGALNVNISLKGFTKAYNAL